jgi:hypothetical protein
VLTTFDPNVAAFPKPPRVNAPPPKHEADRQRRRAADHEEFEQVDRTRMVAGPSRSLPSRSSIGIPAGR